MMEESIMEERFKEFMEKMDKLCKTSSRVFEMRNALWAKKFSRGKYKLSYLFPSLKKEGSVTVKVDMKAPLLIYLLTGVRHIDEITVSYYRHKTILFHFSKTHNILISPDTFRPGESVALIIAAALLYKLAKEQGTDIFSLLEEELGAPGAFSGLRTIFDLTINLLERSGGEGGTPLSSCE